MSRFLAGIPALQGGEDVKRPCRNRGRPSSAARPARATVSRRIVGFRTERRVTPRAPSEFIAPFDDCYMATQSTRIPARMMRAAFMFLPSRWSRVAAGLGHGLIQESRPADWRVRARRAERSLGEGARWMGTSMLQQ